MTYHTTPSRANTARPTTLPSATLHLLGPPRITSVDGKKHSLGPKATLLLAYLALEGPTTRERLADLLWPEADQKAARQNLRQLLTRIKATGAISGESEVLQLTSTTSVIAGPAVPGNPADHHAHHPPTPSRLFEGIELEQNPDLQEWLENKRATHHEAQRRMLLQECDRLEATQDHQAALQAATRLLALDPLNELAHRRVIRAHYLAGDRTAALKAFQGCKEILQRELGLAPEPATIELAEAVSRAAEPSDSRRSTGPALPVSLLRPPRLIGRTTAWAALEKAWQEMRPVFVAGSGGLGKTRLVTDFAATKGKWTRVSGQPSDSGFAYATLARLLRTLIRHSSHTDLPGWTHDEVSRLVPELAKSTPPPLAEQHELHRFHEACVSTLAATTTGRACMLLEDLHNFDAASLRFTLLLCDRSQASHELPRLVLTYRPEELPHWAAEDIGKSVSSGTSTLLTLEPLSPAETDELIDTLALEESSADPRQIAARAAGNPFIILELLRSAVQGEVTASTTAAPPSLAALFARRANRLTETALAVARLKAITGDLFGIELSEHVLKVTPAAVFSALDELKSAQITRGEGFTHDLISEWLLEETPVDVLHHLAQRAAAHAEPSSAPPAAIARLWLAAGRPREALPHLLQAGKRAIKLSAHDEATAHFTKAHEIAIDDPNALAQALLGLEEIAARTHDHTQWEALQARLDAVVAQLRDEAMTADLELRKARWWSAHGRPEEAAQHATRAVHSASLTSDVGLQCRAHMSLAGALINMREPRLAAPALEFLLEHGSEPQRNWARLQMLGITGDTKTIRQARLAEAEEAVRLSRLSGDRFQLAEDLRALTLNLMLNGKNARGIETSEEAAALARETGNWMAELTATMLQAYCHIQRAQFCSALALARHMLDLTADKPEPHAQAAALTCNGNVYRAIGDFDTAESLMQAALEVEQGLDHPVRREEARIAIELGRLELDPSHDVTTVSQLLEQFSRHKPSPAAGEWRVLAITTTDPQGALAAAERAEELAKGFPVIDLFVAIARLKAALLLEERDLDERMAKVQHLADAERTIMSSLGHLILHRACQFLGRADGAARHLTRARELCRIETKGLEPRLVATRWARLNRLAGTELPLDE